MDFKNGAAVAAALDKHLKMKPGVAERSARAIRLKEELNLILELVVKMRKRLEGEEAQAVSGVLISKEFVAKLKDLTHCYQTLTKSRIDLDKAERSMENDMTPAQEKKAVKDYVSSLGGAEKADLIKDMWAEHLRTRGKGGPPSAETLSE